MIRSDYTSLDLSAITGEFVPVSGLAADSSLARIVHILEEAQGQRATARGPDRPVALASGTQVQAYRRVMTAETEPWAPDACTLPTAERPLREAEFDDFFTTSVRAVHRHDATALRLDLEPSADVAARAANLAVRETGCCSAHLAA